MSATLTTKRKSARDRPRQVMREWGGLGRESGRSTEVLVVSRPARIRVQIHTPKGSIEPPCIADPRRARCCAASTPSQPMSPPSPACARPASLLLLPAPSPARLSLLLSLSLQLLSLLRKHLRCCNTVAHVARHLCSARADACVR